MRLPSWPARVYQFRRGREATVDPNDSLPRFENKSDSKPDTNADAMLTTATAKTPRFLQAGASRLRAGRARRGLFFILILTIATLFILFLWLYDGGRFGSLGALFKETTVIRLNQGTYVGEVISKSSKYPRAIQAFRGIPYAQSTAGENRFEPPQPLTNTHKSHGTPTYALKHGNICPQLGGGKGQGEDCLNLNIYRPHYGNNLEAGMAEMTREDRDSKKLPVVVYVHGGGFNKGKGYERNMGYFAAWSDTPVVAMSFNYRVGALGFLPSGLTAKEGLLNLGLKDQQLFFEWVRNNVADLGGDPDNVTIMGMSAGAHSIGHHMISYSPANKLVSGPPPFQKAILESGASTGRAVFSPDQPLHEQQFQEFLMHCGMDNVSDDKLFEELRALPLSTIDAAGDYMWKHWSPTLRWPFQPVIDGPGGVIPDLPLNSWSKGHVLRIPTMTGFNTNEGSIFVPEKSSNSSALRTLMSSIIPSLNETDLDTMNTMYPDPESSIGKKMYVDKPPQGFGSQFWRLDDAYAHYAYICPVLQTADLASTAKDAGPVYVYHYAARSNFHGHAAADHGDEAVVVAHDMDKIGKYPGVVTMADAMTGYWSRFAATDDPNRGPDNADKSNVSWPKFISPFTGDGTGKLALLGQGNDERLDTRGHQNRGVPAQVVSLTDREVEECRFWMDRSILSQGFGNGSSVIL